ncbi:hypothetical protein NDU88_001980 [Pleurodeles waltl]|uniref:Uncharacterized protein n=1 Tax=Pleurodeles waltl TaxID=8319 RepID=A0AAV7TJG7_PLEWA|nr:hypothetical protein NDU88_001980 [Pleurodeles waltl]
MDLRRSIASSLRAAGLTGAGPEVPGAKEMPTLLGERAKATRREAIGREVLERRMAAVSAAGVVTEVSATNRELPLEEESESVLSPPVSAVVLPSPSVPLIPSASVDSASWVLWNAAPSVAGTPVPPPDDANAHMNRMTEAERGEGEKESAGSIIAPTPQLGYTVPSHTGIRIGHYALHWNSIG